MKTKMNIKSIILIAMICLSSLFFINMSFAANTAKIKVETVNLREEPSADSKILEQTSVGDEVEVLEKSGEWYKVKYKSITGYLRNDLLELTETANIINNVTVNEADINIVSNTVNETTNNTTVTEVANQEDNTLGTYKLINDETLKITPLINSLDIKTVKANEQVEVTNIINDWANVTTSEGTQGWIRVEKIQKNTSTENNTVAEENNQQTTETVTQPETNLNVKMYVNTQTVNLRESADKTAKIVTQLEINKEVNVLSKENGWSYVEVDGKKGYVSTSLLSTTKQTTSRSTMNQRTTTKTTSNNATTDTTAKASNTTASTTTSSSTTNTTSTGKGSEVVAYAKTLLGCKYVYGGTTPSGFDCSGFTQYVYKHFGVNLNRTAAAQYSNGKSVTSLQAGDLVMFGKSGISHVGIYIGGNSFIHAANPSKGVRIDSLSSGYYKTNYVGARRIY